MVVKSDVLHDSRVRRASLALTNQGFEVVIIGDSGSGPGPVDAATVHFVRSPLKTSIPRPAWQTFPRWLLLPQHRSRVQKQFQDRALTLGKTLGPFDFVHAHDYSAGTSSTLLAAHFDAKLIYDAHEWWRGRVRFGRPEPLRRWLDGRREDRILERADHVITVSEEIASQLRARTSTNVTVVHNSFSPGPKVSRRQPRGLVYAGRISQGRDLETVVAAAKLLDLTVTFMGASDESVQISSPVVSIAEGSLPQVNDLILDNGIVVVPLASGPANHAMALPNKLFHAISCGAPVVAADLPALRRVVMSHGLGSLYTPGDSDSLVQAVMEVVRNFEEYSASSVKAQADLSWPVDSKILTGLYSQLASM